ncbi:2-oxo-4-hydroxy-4-carboxy-5-ureidoimidazoline decarboxylase [Humibacter antri]
MLIDEFNALPAQDAAAALRPCLDVERWGEAIVAARPFADRDALIAFASTAATPFTEAELERALSHHPRIGERASGDSAEADMSRREQAGLTASDRVAAAIAEGNRAYDAKFDRVFLIRAAGHSAEEILEELTARLGNTAEAESRIIDQQLREIAALRLQGVVSA